MRKFTADELADYNGLNGKPAYVSYNGKVYDVSGSDTWEEGFHFHDEHRAGKDLTENMLDAPHDGSVMDRMPIVGELAEK